MAFTHKTRVQFPAGEHFFSLFFSSFPFFFWFSFFFSFCFCGGRWHQPDRSIDRLRAAYYSNIYPLSADRSIDRSTRSIHPPYGPARSLSPRWNTKRKKKKGRAKREVLPGLEPGSSGSEPEVLTNYTIEPSLLTERKRTCLDRGSNTGPLDLQSNALPTELSKQVTFIQQCQSPQVCHGFEPERPTKKKATHTGGGGAKM